jgi:hypothetical protein
MGFLTLSSQVPGWHSNFQKFLPQRENQLLFSPTHVPTAFLSDGSHVANLVLLFLDVMRITLRQTMEKDQ